MGDSKSCPPCWMQKFLVRSDKVVRLQHGVHSKSKCNKQPRFSWSLIYEKHRGSAPRPGRVAPKSGTGNTKKEPPFCGLPKINYLCIVMYKQLTSEQRSQIFALLQRKSPRKEIAHIVGISQSTLSRELKRNSSLSGK